MFRFLACWNEIRAGRNRPEDGSFRALIVGRHRFMKLHQLRDVVAVAERGSLRAASRHLGIAQPSLTRSISELERELGVALFHRQARGVALTTAGRLFLRRAASITREMERAKEELDQFNGTEQGKVVACLSAVPHIALLPHALRPFAARYPGVHLHLIEGVYPPTEPALLDGSIDFYVGPAPEGALAPGLSRELLFDNRIVVLARHGHPLAQARSLQDLVGAAWISTSYTHSTAAELGVLFSSHGLPQPRFAMRTQSAFSLLMALTSTDFLAMAPLQWTEVGLFRRGIIRLQLNEPLQASPIVLIQRTGLPLTPAAQHFADLLRRGHRAPPQDADARA
ncbi:LysR substrate-binding domain-containing protein [Roseomonas sp. BN140053]|uniref:LysR substrate-binding domain-containing protein n=1 Tax=Roseomonas sp. BN140053 TaxID=3391898 RepID=UPI0039EA1591